MGKQRTLKQDEPFQTACDWWYIYIAWTLANKNQTFTCMLLKKKKKKGSTYFGLFKILSILKSFNPLVGFFVKTFKLNQRVLLHSSAMWTAFYPLTAIICFKST